MLVELLLPTAWDLYRRWTRRGDLLGRRFGVSSESTNWTWFFFRRGSELASESDENLPLMEDLSGALNTPGRYDIDIGDDGCVELADDGGDDDDGDASEMDP